MGWWAVEVFADVKDISINLQCFKEDRLPAVVVMGTGMVSLITAISQNFDKSSTQQNKAWF